MEKNPLTQSEDTSWELMQKYGEKGLIITVAGVLGVVVVVILKATGHLT